MAAAAAAAREAAAGEAAAVAAAAAAAEAAATAAAGAETRAVHVRLKVLKLGWRPIALKCLKAALKVGRQHHSSRA